MSFRRRRLRTRQGKPPLSWPFGYRGSFPRACACGLDSPSETTPGVETTAIRRAGAAHGARVSEDVGGAPEAQDVCCGPCIARRSLGWRAGAVRKCWVKGCQHLQVLRGAAGGEPPLAGWDRADPSSCGVGTGRVQAAPSHTVGQLSPDGGEDSVHHLGAESLSLTTADGHVPHPGLCPGSVLLW